MLYWCLFYFFLGIGLTFPFIELHNVHVLSHFSRLLRSLYSAVHPFGVSAAPPCFVSSVHLIFHLARLYSTSFSVRMTWETIKSLVKVKENSTHCSLLTHSSSNCRRLSSWLSMILPSVHADCYESHCCSSFIWKGFWKIFSINFLGTEVSSSSLVFLLYVVLLVFLLYFSE